MRHVILAIAVLGIVGCTSTTIHQDGEEVSVIVETSRLLFRDASGVRKKAEDEARAACPVGTVFTPSDSAKGKAVNNFAELSANGRADVAALTNLINAADALHEAVKGWIGRTTIKLTGKCSRVSRPCACSSAGCAP